MVPGFRGSGIPAKSGAGARLPANGGAPSWLGIAANSGFPWVGRAGGVRRGRRKPVHGGLAAASMPRIPRLTPPARPWTGSCARQPRKTRRKDQKQRPVAALSSTHGVDLPVPGTSRSTPCVDEFVRHQNQSGVRARCEATGSDPVPFWQLAGNCRRRGGSGCGGVSGMGPRHASGGLGRTPNPGLAVCAGKRTRASRDQASMDGFTACPASPHRPTQPSDSRLLLWLLLRLWPSPWVRRVPGAARPKPTPRFRYNVGPVSQLRFPGHDGPRGRARPVAVPPRTS